MIWTLAACLIALVLVSCDTPTAPYIPPNNDVPLIGSWYMDGTKALEFKATTMIMYAPNVMVTYSYRDFRNGHGEYWLATSPNVKVIFTYVITGKTMQFTIAPYTFTYTRP